MNNYNLAAGSIASSAPPSPWIDLPRDVMANILLRLGPEEILNSAERVCTTWRSVCGEPSHWRIINTEDFDNLDTLDPLCRRAVDRSRGELIDLSIVHVGTDDLFRYISERSGRLKILNLESCRYISSQGLATAVKNFPHLRELRIFSMPSICALDIETIGVSCPMLKSFTFSNPFVFPSIDIDNSCALSIAKTMPNLLRICLVGNRMGNEGLLAILDCCPNLESLDLRECFGVHLKCDLRRRCLEQIKELKNVLVRSLDLLDDRFLKPEVV